MAVISPGPKTPRPVAKLAGVPPLENGDRLTREEFERRYDAMPHLKKAELIEGEVYVASPARHKSHSLPHVNLLTWIGTYASATAGTEPGDSGTIRLDLDNEPQPDAYLMIAPDRGGRVKFSDDDYVEGAPELIAEIAASSVSYDLGKKLNVYRRNKVQEYIVWRVLDAELDWFVLRGGKYEALEQSADALLRSIVFPGLWLDSAALIRGDMPGVLTVLEQGLRSVEHAEFRAKLAAFEKQS
jgi:Uma2 family endonuclease